MTDNGTERTSAPRPRIIERWFPCAEVSAASSSGWGSSNSETLLMSWFAKRPLAQSRAAVLCSLLPWPEDPDEQERVQAVIREALGSCQDPNWYACRQPDCDDLDCNRKTHMSQRQASNPHAHGIVDCARQDPNDGYDAARTDVIRLLKAAYPDRPAEMLDPFSGRGLIPIEAARYGQQAHAIDYSPVAALASRLLIDWPFRDWSNEPELPFDPPKGQASAFDPSDPQRLVRDIEIVQTEVQRRIDKELDGFYPDNDRGEKPWGYLWASAIDCAECGREFPLFASTALRSEGKAGQELSLELVTSSSSWEVEVVTGKAAAPPTMRSKAGRKGKLAWCPYRDCGHAHELPEHKSAVAKDFDRVRMMAVADIVDGAKTFRSPMPLEIEAANRAAVRAREVSVNGLPAIPDETIVPGSSRIMGVHYGAVTYGDLSHPRQNLQHAVLAQAIAGIADEVIGNGGSREYARALSGYCSASFARKLKYATRGAWLRPRANGAVEVAGIFINESSLGFNYDFFEVGLGHGPGSWATVAGVPTALRGLVTTRGRSARVERGSALALPYNAQFFDAVVTDPPYDAMINYSDASDLFYVWLRRALAGVNPDFAMTSNPRGTQENAEEIIVSHFHNVAVANDHRTPAHYDRLIADAFKQCREVVSRDGVVTIVFGHGEPEVWRRILDAISEAGLMMTGTWPANTEKGGQAGSANINTTLTLACRPAPTHRPDGRVAEVDAEMRRVIAGRVQNVWGPSGLSYVDQKMAAAGPALEVVGRYERILDKKGRPVDLDRYLPLARQAVTDAHDLRFDSLPLETFDQKTRFALEWVKAYGRQVQAASEARWQRLAADLEEHETEGVLKDVSKGVRLILSKEAGVDPVEGMPLFEVALAAASGWRQGSLANAAAAIRAAGVDPKDQHFWACINALSKSLPETDPDGTVWTSMVRNREALAAGVANAEAAVQVAQERAEQFSERNPQLFEDPNSLFGREGD